MDGAGYSSHFTLFIFFVHLNDLMNGNHSLFASKPKESLTIIILLLYSYFIFK